MQSGNTGELRKHSLFDNQYLSFLGDKSFAVCLSHDVDNIRKRHQYFSKFKQNPFGQIRSFFGQKEPYWNFDLIKSIESDYNVKSTFFFICEEFQSNIFKTLIDNKSAARYNIRQEKLVKVIKDLDSSGWEVGLHGSFKSYNDKNILQSEKKLLENILGHKVEGVRQHYLNLDIPSTWQIQNECGFSYDCSFGFNNQVGFKQKIFYPFSAIEENFIMIPVSLMDTVLFHYYDEKEVWEVCKKLIHVCESNKSILNLIWHQESFSKVDFPNFTHIYQKIIEYCLKRNAKFTTTGELSNYILSDIS